MFVSPSNSLWLFVDTLCSKSWSWQTVINYVQYQYPSNIESWPCSCLVMWYCIHAYVCILLCIWYIYIYTWTTCSNLPTFVDIRNMYVYIYIYIYMRCWHACPYVQIILMIYIYIYIISYYIFSYDPYLLILSDIPYPPNSNAAAARWSTSLSSSPAAVRCGSAPRCSCCTAAWRARLGCCGAVTPWYHLVMTNIAMV